MSAMQAQLSGARVVDLFAGSGALGLEALSRGATHATFVERSNAAIRTLKANLGKLGVHDDEYRIVRGDALAYAQSLSELAFDIALADPPYGTNDAVALVDTFTRTPFAAWLWLEHRAAVAVPAVPGARTRRYGDVALTSMNAKC